MANLGAVVTLRTMPDWLVGFCSIFMHFRFLKRVPFLTFYPLFHKGYPEVRFKIREIRVPGYLRTP